LFAVFELRHIQL